MVLKASDATSNTISLSCKVEAGNDYDRIESGGPPGLTLQLNNNVQTNVTITGPLTASGTGYIEYDTITFYAEDEFGNSQVGTYAALHPTVRLDTAAAAFDTSNPWHGSIPEVDNEYVVLVFVEPVFGDAIVNSAVHFSDFLLTFDNSGTATGSHNRYCQ